MIDGERVNRRGRSAYPDIATAVLYEAARRRTFGVPTPS
jgi:hypothetical protein